jgi:serine/threonine-protein kinase
MDEQTPKRVGDYEILEILGAGGMGKVYKVRNVISDRIEAMKVVLPELAGQEDLIKRFQNEIKLVAALHHPNIAVLHTALTVDGQFVMVMEFVEGISLARLLERGPIPVAQAVDYTSQVLSALSYAHGKGVIHRDIKPSNMMLTPAGVVKLMDFGIARSGKDSTLTTEGTTLGSLYYMSPEQVKGEAIDGRSDIYALGISLYEMVTGQKPFENGTDYSVMAAHLEKPPKPPIEVCPDLPLALNEIILLAVAKDPAQRFQSPEAMRRALENVHMEAANAATMASMPAGTSVGAAASAPTIAAPVMPIVVPEITKPTTDYVPVPAPPRSGSHRGLYMTLGALIVLAGLAAAGLYIPKMYKTHAADNEQRNAPPTQAPASLSPTTPVAPAATVSAPETPATSPAASTMPTSDATNPAPPSATPPVPPTSAVPVKQTAKNSAPRVGKAADSKPGVQASAQDAAARAAEEADLKQVEHDSGLLNTRMAASDASLDGMKAAQAKQGYGLRADIAAAQERLHANMAKLDAAIASHDLKAAKHFQDLCDRDADTIDKFLGH